MVDIRIDVRADLKRVIKSLSAFADKQIPFATAQALSAIAADVAAGEKEEIRETFETATPFTVGSVGVRKARKDTLTATVFLKDVAAAYLQPYIAGGKHKLNSHALLNPKSIGLNQYGNIPKNRLSALRARADVFIGGVKTKGGATINGVWQRMPAVAAGKATKTRKARVAKAAHLKLLIRFGDALPVTQRLPWGAKAQQIVDKTFDKHFGRAMARAIATARLK